jgi:hypothetical protein
MVAASLAVGLSPGFLDNMEDSSMETSQGVLSGRGGSMVEVNVLLSREALKGFSPPYI